MRRIKCCPKCEAPPVIGGHTCWDDKCVCHSKGNFCPIHGSDIACNCPSLDPDGRPLRKKTLDNKCYELAEHFLVDHPVFSNSVIHKTELAIDIQGAVEDWFFDHTN